MNNKIDTKTIVYFDFIDRIKILFGRKVVVNIKIFTLDDDTEFPPYSATSYMEFENKTNADFNYQPKFGFKASHKE